MTPLKLSEETSRRFILTAVKAKEGEKEREREMTLCSISHLHQFTLSSFWRQNEKMEKKKPKQDQYCVFFFVSDSRLEPFPRTVR